MRYIKSWKLLLLWGCLLLTTKAVSGQPRYKPGKLPNIRHVQGLHGIALNMGKASIGRYCLVDWGYYYTPHWQLKVGLGAERHRSTHYTYQHIYIQPVFSRTMYSNHTYWFFSMLGGANLHIEHHVNKQQEAQAVNVGLVVGTENAFFLARNFEVLLTGGAKILLLKNPYGMLDYFSSLGVRFSFA